MMLGQPDLRNKLAQHYSPLFNNALKRQLDPNKEILVTCGASSALFCIIMNMVGAGDEVLMFEPYYSMYVN